MTDKELIKEFKRAPWKNKEETEVFLLVSAKQQIRPPVLAQMLSILCNRRAAANDRVQSMRCAVFERLSDGVDHKGLFTPYVEALPLADDRVRPVLVKRIPKVNNPREHGKLCDLLRSQDQGVRQVAAKVLKKVGGKMAIEILGELVLEAAFQGRRESMEVAVSIAGHYAIDILKGGLAVGSPQEKVLALKILSDEHYMAKVIPKALKALLKGLESESEMVVSQAILSFSSLCDEEDYFEYIAPFLDSPSPGLVRSAIPNLKRFHTARSIALLDRKLRGGPNIVRMQVLDTLEQIGNNDVLPPLVEALSNKHIEIRNRASEVLSSLSRSGKVETSRVIIWLLRSPDVNVRRVAVELARSIPDPEGQLWPKLLAALRDVDWWVRERVKDALVEMAGKQLTPSIVGYLKDPYDVIRRFAVEILQQVGDPRALGALITAAREDEDWLTREKAIEAAASLKDERAVPYIIDIMKREEDLRFVCIQALIDLEARSAVKQVAGLLESDNSDTRLAALRFLDHFQATQFAPQVLPLREDSSVEVSNLAREMMVRWEPSMAGHQDSDADRNISILDRMLIEMANSGADDLILASGQRSYMKKLDKVIPVSSKLFSAEQVETLLRPLLSVSQLEALEALHDVDFSYDVRSRGLRFRINVFNKEGGLGAVFRIIKSTVPDLQKLGLPEVVMSFGDLTYGLVLVGGPTGSGKSTTLAAIIDYINRTYNRHVISLEDPIEVVHESKKGLVNQREVGTHTSAFSTALRSILRQDPDVILVGEMRDLETIAFAIAAADSGHLVFGTLHTATADTSIDRLINAFPSEEKDQVRISIAENLRAVLCQYLLKRVDQDGRRVAAEVMINNDAISNLIRKGKTYQIPSVVATSREQGMQSMDNELMRLYRAGVISVEDAYMKANSKKEFEDLVGEEGRPKDVPASADAGRPPDQGPDGEALVVDLLPGQPAGANRGGGVS